MDNSQNNKRTTPINSLNTNAVRACMVDCLRHCIDALLNASLPDLLPIVTRYADALASLPTMKLPGYAEMVHQAVDGNMGSTAWDAAFDTNLIHQLGMDSGTRVPGFFWQMAAYGALSQPDLLREIPAKIYGHWREHIWMDTPTQIHLNAAPLLLIVAMAAANVQEYAPRQKARLGPMVEEIASMAETLPSQIVKPSLWDQWLLVRALRLWQMKRWPSRVVSLIEVLPLYVDIRLVDAPDWFVDQWDQLR